MSNDEFREELEGMTVDELLKQAILRAPADLRELETEDSDTHTNDGQEPKGEHDDRPRN